MPTITTSTQCVAVVRCLLDVLASKLFYDVGIFSRESFIQILRFNLDSVIVVLESEACRAAEARGLTPDKSMPADMMTKALYKNKHAFCRDYALNR